MEWYRRNTVDFYSEDVPFESRLGTGQTEYSDGFTVVLRANGSLRQEYFIPILSSSSITILLLYRTASVV
jgi:hypothetical protein